MGNLCCFARSNTVRQVQNSLQSTDDASKTNSTSHKGSSYHSNGHSTFGKRSIEQNEGHSLRGFTYSEMRIAAQSFCSERRLGEGRVGVVYRGYLHPRTLKPVKSDNGMPVAIKKLNLEGVRGHDEWVTEVKFLGALDHPNIVRLVGFCAEKSNQLLVYEYLSRGSLESHLFRHGSQKQGLSWDTRMKIAVGAARGLAFLHDAKIHIIYRNFKAANILLDDQYNAKLSDFGLAKDGPSGDDTHVTTRVMGTYGYAAPEYLVTGQLTSKSDVYSFGVVLLELLSGRRALDMYQPSGEVKLVEWAMQKSVTDILDPRLVNGKYSRKGVHRVAKLARKCLNEHARERPLMKEVVESLEPLLISSAK